MRLFPMISRHGRCLLARAGGALAITLLLAGCGDNYRPIITPVYSNGPEPQPAAYAIVVSSTGASKPGVVSIVDYSGDSILSSSSFSVGGIKAGPVAFTLDSIGGTGFTLNTDNTLTNFNINTTGQWANNILISTVSPSSQIVNLMAPSTGLWTTDLNGDAVDLFSGSPEAFKEAVPVASSGTAPTMPVFIAGASSFSGQREYVVSQNQPDLTGQTFCNNPANFTAAPNGWLTPIEITTDTADPPIATGKCPVYAVQTPDLQRMFVLNRGDDTLTVLNTNINALDQCTPHLGQSGNWVTCHPVIPLSLNAVAAIGAPWNGTAGMTTTAGPVYAEYNAATQQLVVADYDGGTISVIDVPIDEYGDDSNTYTNSTCATYAACGAITGGFGTIHTIQVGNTTHPNPASVTVLNDGSKAYTANQNDDSSGNGTGSGTVSVVNLSTYTVEKTIPVAGHPRTVVNIQNSEYAKIYAVSPDSPYLAIIESSPTITDQIDTELLLQGYPIDVRTTSQNGASGNNNYSSRVPGYGQPCNLSDQQLTARGYLGALTLAECEAQQ